MWPRGNPHQQLATIDGRLANIAASLREARGSNKLALLVDLEARYNELLDDHSLPILGGLASVIHGLFNNDRLARWLRTNEPDYEPERIG